MSPAGASDRALFTNTAATRSFVTFDTNVNVAAMVASGSTSVGPYNFIGGAGSLTVAGLLDFNNSVAASSYLLSNGLQANAATVNVATGCVLNVATSANLTTSGSIVLSAGGAMDINSATATGFLDHVSGLTSGVTSGTFNAKGFNVRGGGAFEIRSGGVFNFDNDPYGNANDGTISSGVLRLLAGGTMNFVGTRVMQVSANALFDLKRDFSLPTNGTINVITGADILSTSNFDIGNGRIGTVTLDGSGSSLTSTANTSTWGSNSGNATVSLTNSAAASLAGLSFGENNGAASLTIASNAQLAVSGALTAGGGAAARTVAVSVNAGTLTLSGVNTFNNAASLNIGTSAIVNLNGNTTFNAGSTLSMTGGAMVIASGKTLNINGTTATVAGGFALSDGATLNITNNGTLGGTFNSASYIDIGTSATATRTGTLLVSGVGTSYSTGTTYTDLGRHVNNTATATFDNFATGNFNAGLQVAANGGTATLNVLNSAIVNIASQFGAGGLATSVANVNVSALGTINFNTDASFGNGSKLTVTGTGKWNIGDGKTLFVNGGAIVSVPGGTGKLSKGASISVLNGGHFTTESYLDFASYTGVTTTSNLTVTGTGSTYTDNSSIVTDFGPFAGNTSTITVASGGAATFNGGLQIGYNGGTATLNVNTGGTVNAFGLGVGDNSNAAVVNLAGGNLAVTEDINLFGSGAAFNYSAGTFNLASGKLLAFRSGAKGNFTIGGLAQTSGTSLNVLSGSTFKTNGFYDMHTNSLAVDGAGSTFETGGTTPTDWAFNSADTATVTVSNSAVASYGSGLQVGLGNGAANITLSNNGTLKTVNRSFLIGGASTATTVGNIVINATGGSHLNTEGAGADLILRRNAAVTLTDSYIFVSGALKMSSNAKITIVKTAAPTTDRIFATGLTMADTSTIDLADQSMHITYTGASPVTTLRNYIQTGYAGGTWTGTGITSSFITTNPRTAIAYIDIGTFVEVGIAEAGDATLDNTVNFDDLIQLAQNYNKPGDKFWQNGDFTYDGIVNFGDLIILAQNYNHTYPNVAATNFSADFAADWAMAQALVPEPVTLAAVLAVAPLAARRRR